MKLALGVPVPREIFGEGSRVSSLLGQIVCICTEKYGSAESIEWFAAILDHVPGTS